MSFIEKISLFVLWHSFSFVSEMKSASSAKYIQGVAVETALRE